MNETNCLTLNLYMYAWGTSRTLDQSQFIPSRSVHTIPRAKRRGRTNKATEQVASYPGSWWAGKERAWYPLFAHALEILFSPPTKNWVQGYWTGKSQLSEMLIYSYLDCRWGQETPCKKFKKDDNCGMENAWLPITLQSIKDQRKHNQKADIRNYKY